MSATTGPTTTLALRIPQSMKAELGELAKSTGRNRNTLAQEALRRFIDQQRWQIGRIEEGVRQAKSGIFVPDEEIDELWAEFGLEPETARDRAAG